MEFGRALRHIGLAFRRDGDRMLEKYGLTTSQMSLMMFLFRKTDEGEFVIQRDIEEGLHLKTPTISGTLDRLEKNGFLQRAPDPDNRRVNRVILTQKAKAMKQEGRRDMEAFEQRVLSPLNPQEQAQLREMLERILEHLPQ